MGTVIGIDLRDPDIPLAAIAAVEAWLTEVDERFSPFRPESEVSRLGRGDLELDDCAPDVRFVLTQCEMLRIASGGAFDVRAPGLRNGLDPSGYVKGWAVEEAAHILEAAGARNYVVNAGGDVLVRGEPEAGRSWIVGIRHPLNADQVVARVALPGGPGRSALATSGSYERGAHIVDPLGDRDADGSGKTAEWVSLSVAGPSLALADAYATAAFAMGRAGLTWLAGRPSYEGYAIDPVLHPSWTPGFDPLLV